MEQLLTHWLCNELCRRGMDVHAFALRSVRGTLQRLWLFSSLYELKLLHDEHCLVCQRMTRCGHFIGPHPHMIMLELLDALSVTLPSNQAWIRMAKRRFKHIDHPDRAPCSAFRINYRHDLSLTSHGCS